MSKGTYGELLKNWGFQAFLWTQFLAILNDNIFKFVITFFAVDYARQLIAMGVETGQRDYVIPLIGAIFVLPYLLFSGWAGYLADTFNKRKVLIVTKSMEMFSMALAIPVFAFEQLYGMYIVLFLMAAQTTFFSPAKYGILPEMLPERDLSRANGLLEMSTFVAIIMGSSCAGGLYNVYKEDLWFVGTILFVISVIGWLISFSIHKVTYQGGETHWNSNPWSEIWIGTKAIYNNRALWLVVLGVTYFWFLGALFQMDLVDLGEEILQLNEWKIGLLFTYLAVGIGVGSMAAGWLSGNKIELGLVPFGTAGVGLFSILLYFITFSYILVAIGLAMLGFAAGFFSVPLLAYLQHRSGERERGRILATSNFINTIGILLASVALYVCRAGLDMESNDIILLFGIITLLGTFYVLFLLPDLAIRLLFWLMVHSIYNIRITGQHNIPKDGPVLLVCNHTSYSDGPVIGGCIPRPVRFLIYHFFFKFPIIGHFLRWVRSIPVKHTVRGISESLKQARARLKDGDVVCIFPEGGLSRNGNMLPFQRGIIKVVEGMNAPIVPIYIDGLWGSLLSYKQDKAFLRFLREFRRPVRLVIGKPLAADTDLFTIRRSVQELGTTAFAQRPTVQNNLSLRFLQSAKRNWRHFCMADSTGKELTFGKTLIAAWLLRGWIKKHCADEEMVGLMLPATVGGALANLGVSLANKIPVNLNFTIGNAAMHSSIEQCNIRTIITSRTFVKKAGLDEMESMVFMEDLLREFQSKDKLLAAITTYCAPAFLLRRWIKPEPINPEEIATIIFSSGSTGMPKGVMLSHKNILSNLESAMQTFNITKKDCMIGVLPFFHSFGFTCELWLPLIKGFGVAFHPNPIDAKTIGEITQKYKGSIIISTSTFCQNYIRKCEPEQFQTLRIAVVGAEKLRETVDRRFREKFGLDLQEGYGCTELSPVVSVNIDDVETGGFKQIGHKKGTVGHPIPGVAAKAIDLDTEETLGPNETGMLLIKGPNCMLGYYKQPEKTKEAFHGEWYITGDVGCVDDDGFIKITDRLSRFSKIGGEMIPHIRVEEAINEILGEASSVVTAVPDEKKGERLVVLLSKDEVDPLQVHYQLKQSNLPNLWVPKFDDFYTVDEIPTLASGKVDLRGIQQLARKVAGVEES